MNQKYSQCDIHSGEYIVGLCFDKQCLQKPEYCFDCKQEGQHSNHQVKCKKFSDLKTKLSETNNILIKYRDIQLEQLQNFSQCQRDMLQETYKKKFDECQSLIQISQDENVEQSKNKIDLYQLYLEFDFDELRVFIERVEKIQQQFNDEMKEAIKTFEFPIKKDLVLESNPSYQQSEAKLIYEINQEKQNQIPLQNNNKLQEQLIQQVNEMNDEDEDDFFKLQMQMIQEDEQNQNIQKSLQLTDQANQNAANPQIAIQLLDQALELYENNEIALLSKGKILHTLGKYDQSMKPLYKLIEQNSQMSDAYFYYGDCLFYTDKLQEADKFYQKAIQMNQNNYSYYVNRANVLNLLGQYYDVIDLCDKAISLNQQNPATAHNNKAYALWKLNKIQDALDNYSQAIQLQPSSSIFLANKGMLLLFSNKLDEAIVCLNKIEQLNERIPLYFQFKTELLIKQGKQGEASETCKQGLQFYPQEQALLVLKQQLF